MGSLGGPLRLDMDGELRGFAMPRTNPTSCSRWPGRRVGDWLTTAIRCRIDGDALDARTEILVSRLSSRGPAADDQAQARIGLPLGMIVALMKDAAAISACPAGARTAERSTLRFSEALWSTIRNVAVKAITAPVSWIGRVQVRADSRIQRVEIDPIPFAPGSATLAAEAQEQVARFAAFLEQVPGVRLSLMPAVSSQDRAALEEKTRPPADGPVPEKKTSDKGPSKTDLADLAARRLEAVREGIKKAGVDSGRLKVAALSPAESAEGRIEVDLVEPEDPGPPGRPGFLRRLLGQTGSDGRPVLK